MQQNNLEERKTPEMNETQMYLSALEKHNYHPNFNYLDFNTIHEDQQEYEISSIGRSTHLLNDSGKNFNFNFNKIIRGSLLSPEQHLY